jgi:hypothetical protein
MVSNPPWQTEDNFAVRTFSETVGFYFLYPAYRKRIFCLNPVPYPQKLFIFQTPFVPVAGNCSKNHENQYNPYQSIDYGGSYKKADNHQDKTKNQHGII